jgi:hypothetical protein
VIQKSMRPIRQILFLLFLFSPLFLYSQYNWKLEKNKDGIQLYVSDVPHSSFKAVRVECTLKGSYVKLISILQDVPKFNKWIYNTRSAALLKQYNRNNFVYYSETKMPWPVANRDVVLNLKINTDSLPKFLSITGESVSGLFPVIPGIVRVTKYIARWKVTAPSPGSIHIHYILELDPGGDLPAWATNMFIDKGPFETFTNLAERLKE